MALHNIIADISDRIYADSTIGLPIFRIDESETPTTDHMRYFVLPAETETPTVPNDGYHRETGILQISIYLKAGKGSIYRCAECAAKVQALFPKGLKLNNVQFPLEASVGQPIPNNAGFTMCPVSISYTNIVQ